MRILMLANHLNRGGITAYMLNLCKVLKGELDLYVSTRGGEMEAEFSRSGIKHIRIPLKTKCEVSVKVFISFFKLIGFVRKEIDLIHANTRVTQVLAALLSFFSRKPYVSTCHGFFKKRFFRKILPCWGERVIAVSTQVEQHLKNDFHLESDRIVLIYNGVDIERFTSVSFETASLKQSFGMDANKKIIGHIGRLSFVKGQRYLILAAQYLVQKRSDVQFLIIGDGREESALKSLIRQHHLERDVILHSSVKDTAGALALMDVFVMPSLQEGLGISILEAQAAGVAVVASRVGGIPDIIEDRRTGLLCEPKNPALLADAIELLLDNADLRSQLTARARKQVEEKFSLKRMARATKAFYEMFHGE